MSRKRRIVMAGGTVLSALGIGFLMQQGETAPRVAAEPPRPVIVQQTGPAQTGVGEAALDLQDIALTAAQPDELIVVPTVTRAAVAVDAMTLPRAPADPEIPQLGCNVAATAVPAAMASVDLTVSAPCLGNTRVTVHHNGMMFSEVTDARGTLSVNIPVLAEKAVFVVAFANGKGAVAQADVPALSEYDRVAVQWTGNAGFQFHAREFGAAYGDAGHSWTGAGADQPARGRVIRLGDADMLVPQLVEIYTFPTASARKSGTIALSVEAEVTSANCSRDIAAQSLELRGDGVLRTRDLVLSMPDCSAIGDFLVLNNLVDDLKIAAR